MRKLLVGALSVIMMITTAVAHNTFFVKFLFDVSADLQ